MVADEVTPGLSLPRLSEAGAPERVSGRGSLLERCRAGLRHPRNWLQLLRFAAVGASGFAVNLAVFTLCVRVADVDYRLGSVIAYIVSVTTNFLLNRHWTFSHRKEDHAGHQALRFLVVSLVAYGVQYLVLVSLVGAGLDKIASQAIAVTVSTLPSFIGQKLWTFRG